MLYLSLKYSHTLTDDAVLSVCHAHAEQLCCCDISNVQNWHNTLSLGLCLKYSHTRELFHLQLVLQRESSLGSWMCCFGRSLTVSTATEHCSLFITKDVMISTVPLVCWFVLSLIDVMLSAGLCNRLQISMKLGGSMTWDNIYTISFWKI